MHMGIEMGWWLSMEDFVISFKESYFKKKKIRDGKK